MPESVEPVVEPVQPIDYSQQLQDIEALLEYQVEYIKKLEAEAEEQKKLEEQQVLEQQKLEEEQQLADQQAIEQIETELEALNTISDNTTNTVTQLETVQAEIIAIKDEQLNIGASMVEGLWIVTLTIAVAVAMKLFWNNTLKW